MAFVSVKTWLLIMCDTGIYAIIMIIILSGIAFSLVIKLHV